VYREQEEIYRRIYELDLHPDNIQGIFKVATEVNPEIACRVMKAGVDQFALAEALQRGYRVYYKQRLRTLEG